MQSKSASKHSPSRNNRTQTNIASSFLLFPQTRTQARLHPLNQSPFERRSLTLLMFEFTSAYPKGWLSDSLEAQVIKSPTKNGKIDRMVKSDFWRGRWRVYWSLSLMYLQHSHLISFASQRASLKRKLTSSAPTKLIAHLAIVEIMDWRPAVYQSAFPFRII